MFNAKTLILVAVVTALALLIGYTVGTQKTSTPPQVEVETKPSENTDMETAAATPLRSGSWHPPMNNTTESADQQMPPLSGQAHQDAQIDPNAKFTHFRVGQRNVKRILADGGLIWVGTSGGVIRYDIKTDDYQLFDIRSGLLANGIFYLGKLDNRLAVGTYGGGLSVRNETNDGWKNYNIPEGLADAFVYDILETDNGDVWIATWSGANRIRGGDLDDPSKWETYTVKNTQGGLPNDWVYSLAKGKNGELWLATEGGLARYKDGQWQNWQHEDGLGAAYEIVKDATQFKNDPAKYSKHHARQKTEMGLEQVDVAYNPNYIVALTIDNDGNVWAGTWGGGLARFDGSSWQNYTTVDGLPGNHIFSLKFDADGQLWVGTNKGLARRDKNGYKIFTTSDGLFSDTVFSMDFADDGSSWIGSYGGVARIAKLQ